MGRLQDYLAQKKMQEYEMTGTGLSPTMDFEGEQPFGDSEFSMGDNGDLEYGMDFSGSDGVPLDESVNEVEDDGGGLAVDWEDPEVKAEMMKALGDSSSGDISFGDVSLGNQDNAPAMNTDDLERPEFQKGRMMIQMPPMKIYGKRR